MNRGVLQHALGIRALVLRTRAHKLASCLISVKCRKAPVLEGNLHLHLVDNTVVNLDRGGKWLLATVAEIGESGHCNR